MNLKCSKCGGINTFRKDGRAKTYYSSKHKKRIKYKDKSKIKQLFYCNNCKSRSVPRNNETGEIINNNIYYLDTVDYYLNNNDGDKTSKYKYKKNEISDNVIKICKLCQSIDFDENEKCKKCDSSKENHLLIDKQFILNTISDDENDSVKKLTTKSLNITSAEELIEYSNVDTSKWQIKKQKITTSEVTISAKKSDTERNETFTNYHISIELEKKEIRNISLENKIEKLMNLNYIDSFEDELNEINFNDLEGDILYEISIFDHHFGSLALSDEVLNDYNLKIAEIRFLNAIKDLCDYSQYYKPSLFLFPIGNDLLHVNSKNITYNNTPQDIDKRLSFAYDVAYDCIIKAVSMLSKIAPVHMIWVPSNHDFEVSYYLTKGINAYYRNNENISVDVTKSPIKCFKWGENLIAFEHGQIKPEKLPLIIADKWKHDWANSKFRQIHAGHLHKKYEMQFTTTDTYGSVIYKRLPSLTGTDLWHFKSGYIGTPKAAQSHLWSKKFGPFGTFDSYIKSSDEYLINQ